MKFIHVSDLHFHRDNNDNKDAIKSLDYIQQAYPNHYLIVTGDIADDGHEEQFENAYSSLSKFMNSDGTPKVFICPGNHDFGAAGNFYSEERAVRFDAMLTKTLRQGGTFTGDSTPVVNILKEIKGAIITEVMLIALDTNIESEHPFDFACGEVGEKQLAALKNIVLNPSTSHMKKILFFHHHPFMHNDPFMELKDARDLLRTIYSRVDVVMFGHKHVSQLWKLRNGIPYILASDNTPGKTFARELEITDTTIAVQDVPIA
jgi:3',5'-cyclic AMP phosphodiesterase CpdA